MSSYVDAGDRDDQRSAGKTLRLPNPPWGVKSPRQPIHDTRPIPTNPSDAPIAQYTEKLYTQLLATIPDDLRRAAVEARDAAQRAAAAVREAQAGMEAPIPGKDAPVEQTAMAIALRAAHRQRLPGLVEVLQGANETYGAALDAVRTEVIYYAGRAIHDDVRRKARQLREEAERLEREAGYREIAISNAIGKMNAWLP